MFDVSANFVCAFCGEANQVAVDISGGMLQRSVEDRQVCCRPNLLRVTFDDDGSVSVEAEQES